MDFIPAPADPERQRALPDSPSACPHCGARAWHRNGTHARHLVVLGRLRVQRWQCKVCHGSASPLPPDVTSRQRPQTFRELVADLYVHSAGFRGLSRILERLGCGVGVATLWRDVQAAAPGRLHVPHHPGSRWTKPGVDRGCKAPRGRGPGPQGERLDLRLRGPGFDWGGWFTDLAERGAQGVTTDDDPVQDRPWTRRGWTASRAPCTGSAPWASTSGASMRIPRPIWTGSCSPSCNGWRGPARRRPGRCSWDCGRRWRRGGCAWTRRCASCQAPRGPPERSGAQPAKSGHPRLHPPPRGLVRPPRPRARLTRGLKTEAGVLNFVGLMAGGMA